VRFRVLSHVSRHALARVGTSLGAAIATYFAVGLVLARLDALLVAWDVGGLMLLATAWSAILQADSEATRDRARADDPGRTLVYVIVVLTSAVSLLAATVLASTAHSLTRDREHAMMLLCLATVSLSWLITHTTFTLRYAHLFYREDSEGIGGVTVPGTDQPTFFDFAYFAFTIGMCFQVSDICVTSRQIRQTVLVHALISFAYNSVILAFVLNLVFSLAE
jgi:uncharacterized membrane protein